MSSYESPNAFNTNDEGGLAVEEIPNPEEATTETLKEAALREEAEEKVDLKREFDLPSSLAKQDFHEKQIQERQIQYEMLRSNAFQRVAQLNTRVTELEEETSQLKSRREYSKEDRDLYETNDEVLSHAKMIRDKVVRFENKVWGNSPEEYADAREKLRDDISNVKGPEDLEKMFSKWGALPGVNTTDWPITNETAIFSFVSKMHELDPVDRGVKAEKLITNPNLRAKILTFSTPHTTAETPPEVILPHEEENFPQYELSPDVAVEEEAEEVPAVRERSVESTIQPPYELAPDVWDETQVAAPQLYASRQSPKNPESTSEEKLEAVMDEKDALIKSREILASKMFQYAPFLMKFTKKGREDLKTLERAGLDIQGSGKTLASLEIARALKLKNIQELSSPQPFAHDLVWRKASQQGDREDLAQKNTQLENVKRIRRTYPQKIKQNVGPKAAQEEQIAEKETVKDENLNPEINKFTAVGNRRRKREPNPITYTARSPRELSDEVDDGDTKEFPIQRYPVSERPTVRAARTLKRRMTSKGVIVDKAEGSGKPWDADGVTQEFEIPKVDSVESSDKERDGERKVLKKDKETRSSIQKELARFNERQTRKKAATQKMKEVTGNENVTKEQARALQREGSRRKRALKKEIK